MIFFLGTHEVSWLGKTEVPLFISAVRLRIRKSYPIACGQWALDSGGFSELSLHGRWTVQAMTYSTEVRRWRDTIGKMQWAANQDWMCEPFIVAKTGFSVREHQRRTIANFHLLRQLAPDIPWMPVIQGWQKEDYLRHVEDYRDSGIDLTAQPLVGVGSICRRQATEEAAEIVQALYQLGLRLHLFGFKLQGLKLAARFASSSDSMAWSFSARKGDRLAGCSHKKCSNCLAYALQWREKAIAAALKGAARPTQSSLWEVPGSHIRQIV